MANYTLEEFKTHAVAGDAILLTKAAGRTDVILKIGGESVFLTEDQQAVTLVNGVRTVASENRSTLDLGLRFTAQEVADSVSLKKAITAGTVYVSEGTASL